MTEQEMRSFITRTIMERYTSVSEDREETLADVLGVLLPQETAGTVREAARMAPALPASLYERWADLFAQRLLETVPHDQVADLCQGTAESEATLALVYVMFMESERMEKVVSDDLRLLGFVSPEEGAAAALVGSWLRARMAPGRNGGAS